MGVGGDYEFRWKKGGSLRFEMGGSPFFLGE